MKAHYLGHVVFYGLGAYVVVATWQTIPLTIASPLEFLMLLVAPKWGHGRFPQYCSARIASQASRHDLMSLGSAWHLH